MIKNLALSLVLAAAACGGSSKPAATTGPSAGETTATTVALELGELKLVDVNKNQTLTIQPDGTIVIPAQPDGDAAVTLKVTTDGKIMAGDQVGLQLMPDGTITGPDGKPLDVTLSADAVITSGDKKISLDDSGALVGANPDAPQMRIEGATTVGLKRTALFVLIALTSGEPAPAPAPSTTPAG